MDIIKLLDKATSVGVGEACKIGGTRLQQGAIPVTVFGDGFIGTIQIEGTISSDEEVAGNNAVWSALDGGSFSANGAMGIFVPFSHIRANVVGITAGNISCRALI